MCWLVGPASVPLGSCSDSPGPRTTTAVCGVPWLGLGGRYARQGCPGFAVHQGRPVCTGRCLLRCHRSLRVAVCGVLWSAAAAAFWPRCPWSLFVLAVWPVWEGALARVGRRHVLRSPSHPVLEVCHLIVALTVLSVLPALWLRCSPEARPLRCVPSSVPVSCGPPLPLVWRAGVDPLLNYCRGTYWYPKRGHRGRIHAQAWLMPIALGSRRLHFRAQHQVSGYWGGVSKRETAALGDSALIRLSDY